MSDWLRRSAALSPEGLALCVEDAALTFGELDRRVDLVVSELVSRGVRRGAAVSVSEAVSVDLVLILLGLVRLGAVPVLVNLRWTGAEVGSALGYLGVSFVVGNAFLGGGLDNDYTKLSIDDIVRHDSSAALLQPTDPNTVVCRIFTSGTSGRPKAVEITRANLLYNAALTALRLGLSPNDHWLCCLPLFHIGGLAMLFRSVIYGLPLTLHTRFDAEAVNRALDTQQITHISLVPTMLDRLLETRTAPPPYLRTVLLGGAAAPVPLVQRARDLNIDIVTTYGLTEATSQVATQMPGRLQPKIGSVGRPAPFVSVTVRRDDLTPCAFDEVGEIYVQGPTVMKGYADDPGATAAAITPHGLRTGDLGYVDDDGELWLVNRRIDLIVSGGENIYPAEVESALLTLQGIRAACVVAVADPVWGQSPAALIVSDVQYTLAALRELLNPVLARYKHPKHLRITDTLPTLANGKVDRRRVAALFETSPRDA